MNGAEKGVSGLLATRMRQPTRVKGCWTGSFFTRGGYMPAAVFPQGEFRREDADERNRGDLHSPATVFLELALSDHFPLVLTLPCDHTRNLHKQGKMALDGLT